MTKLNVPVEPLSGQVTAFSNLSPSQWAFLQSQLLRITSEKVQKTKTQKKPKDGARRHGEEDREEGWQSTTGQGLKNSFGSDRQTEVEASIGIQWRLVLR
jgi:hypothetical protein